MPSSPSSASSSIQDAPSSIELFYKSIYAIADKISHSSGVSNPLQSWGADGVSNQYYGAVCAYVWSLPIQQFWEKQGLYTTQSVEGGKPINKFYNAKTIDQGTTIVSPNTEVLYSNAFIDVSENVVEVNYPLSQGVYTLVEVLDPFTNVQFSGGSAHTSSDSNQVVGQVFYWANASEDILNYIDSNYKDTAIALQSPQAWVLGRVEVDPYQNPSASADAQTPYQSANPNSSLAFGTAKSLNDQFSISIPYPKPPVTPTGTSQVTNPDESKTYEGYFKQVANAVSSNSTYVYYSGTTDGQLNSKGTLYSQSSMFENFGGSGPYSIGLTASAWPGSGSTVIEQGFSDAQSAVSLIGKNSSASSDTQYWSVNTTLGQYKPSYQLTSPGWVTAAAAASVGLGANVAGDGTYPKATQDSSGSSLSTSEDYLIDFSASGLPPIDDPGFWSVTIYDSNNYLVSTNGYAASETYYLDPDDSSATAASGVYALGSAQLSYLDTDNIPLKLSPTAPANQQYWIPTPSSGSTFSVVLRLYNPVPASSVANASVLSSSNPWQPPGIERLSTTTNGRLSGSLVYLDTDGNLNLSANEKSATTNADGQFIKRSLEGSGTLVLEGGQEPATGTSYKGKLFALEGSEVISPLSTVDWGMERVGITEETRKNIIRTLTLGAYEYLNGESLDWEKLDSIDPTMIAPHQVARLDLPYADKLAKATSLVNSVLGLYLSRVYESLEPMGGGAGGATSAYFTSKYPEIVVKASSLIANLVGEKSAGNPFVRLNSVESVVASDLERIAEFAMSISSDPYEAFSQNLSRFKALELGSDGARSGFPLLADSGFSSRDPITGYSFAGLPPRNTNSFGGVLRDSLISPGGSVVKAGGKSGRTLWDVIADDAGTYFEGLTNRSGQLFDLGPTALLGQEHLNVFGPNSFGFDDLLSVLPQLPLGF
ncbi:MAG: hypothetical protein DCO99_10055 [Synechococcus sp. XM-24]|nr:MAG: hypothetical protein DCO99_10055 [Synechococcus sp. XM-24]